MTSREIGVGDEAMVAEGTIAIDVAVASGGVNLGVTTGRRCTREVQAEERVTKAQINPVIILDRMTSFRLVGHNQSIRII